MASTEQSDAGDEWLIDLDFEGARIHAPNFEGAKISDAAFGNADVSGDIEGLLLNGVLVAPLVEAELERREPDRIKLRASTPQELEEAWEMIEARWRATISGAKALPLELAYGRVDHEWSLTETLRHLIFATDLWAKRMIFGQPPPYHPIGLGGSWLENPSDLGLDLSLSPSLDDVLEVRMEYVDLVEGIIGGLADSDLERVCTPPRVRVGR